MSLGSGFDFAPSSWIDARHRMVKSTHLFRCHPYGKSNFELTQEDSIFRTDLFLGPA